MVMIGIRKEMFYLTMHSTHCIYAYMVKENSDSKRGRKEGNVLFNDALNTFLIWLYSIGHMVKDHLDSERKPAATTIWATLSD